MNAAFTPSEEPAPSPRNQPRATLLWLSVASVVGLLCFVLPPFLIPDAPPERLYGQYARTLIQWFANAYANVQFWPSAVSFAVVGLTLGWTRPHSWMLLSWSTVALCALLQATNINYDVSQNPKTHNLLPFEFVIFVIFGFAAVVGGFIGSRLKQFRNPNMASQKTLANPAQR